MNERKILEMVVDRCHVSKTNEEVIEYVISRLKGGQESYNKMPKKDQTVFKKLIRARHKANKKLYRFVMGPH